MEGPDGTSVEGAWHGGECCAQDGNGIWWSWADAKPWVEIDTLLKKLLMSTAGKVRTFKESWQLVAARDTARGYFPLSEGERAVVMARATPKAEGVTHLLRRREPLWQCKGSQARITDHRDPEIPPTQAASCVAPRIMTIVHVRRGALERCKDFLVCTEPKPTWKPNGGISRGREVPTEEMAALRHHIRRLKPVGRTTKNSRLLFTTCLSQMVLGSKGQPREETYVYVELASLWMFVLTLLVMLVLFFQLMNLYGRRTQSPWVYDTPDPESNDEDEEGQEEDPVPESQEDPQYLQGDPTPQRDEEPPVQGDNGLQCPQGPREEAQKGFQVAPGLHGGYPLHGSSLLRGADHAVSVPPAARAYGSDAKVELRA